MCVNVKEFWLSFSTLATAQYFNLTEFWNEERGLPFSNKTRSYGKTGLLKKAFSCENLTSQIQAHSDFFVFENVCLSS